MKIAFDAKRAFHNSRGLGNYSRDTIRLLSSYYPENEYLLFNPSRKNNINFTLKNNTSEILPTSLFGKVVPSLWRSRGMVRELKKQKPNIYHGLSQELPWGIEKAGVKSIVSMHDAIFMRYPQLYARSYRTVFIEKNKYACKVADRIIAISEQTKRDIIYYFDAPEEKIDVVYQGCNNIFREPVSEKQKQIVREKYALPQEYILNVGAIEKRKNAGLIVEALHREKIDIPLIIVGKPTAYIDEIRLLIKKYGMENQVLFIHNAESADLPAIYHAATVFVYPSLFEGFGIPVLESLCSATPVIASTGTCFEEVGGPLSIYIDPENADELGISIKRVLENKSLQEKMVAEGLRFSENFLDENIAHNIMDVYRK